MTVARATAKAIKHANIPFTLWDYRVIGQEIHPARHHLSRLAPYRINLLLVNADGMQRLFAAEHGPYWDVGLLTGFIYNWWMIRTKNLWDCIIAHAVTNGALAAWVVLAGQWQYWL